LSFRPRVRHGVTLLDAECGIWTLDSRVRGNDRGKGNDTNQRFGRKILKGKLMEFRNFAYIKIL